MKAQPVVRSIIKSLNKRGHVHINLVDRYSYYAIPCYGDVPSRYILILIGDALSAQAY